MKISNTVWQHNKWHKNENAKSVVLWVNFAFLYAKKYVYEFENILGCIFVTESTVINTGKSMRQLIRIFALL